MKPNTLMLDKAGTISAILLGIVITVLGGWQHLTIMLVFLTLSVIASKIEKQRKESMGVYEGERTWKNVLSNGLVPALVLVITKDVRYFLAAVAAAQADKFGSEIGVLSKKPPIFLLTLKTVKPGTNGAITLFGLFASFIGALSIALVGSMLFSLTVWDVIKVALAGLGGSIIDSIVGVLEERGIGNKEITNVVGIAGGVIVYALLERLWA